MNTLTMASRRSTHPLDSRAAARAQRRWLGRVGAALWRGFQEARQARPERELLELIERRSVKHFAHAAQVDGAHEFRASARRRAESQPLSLTKKEYQS